MELSDYSSNHVNSITWSAWSDNSSYSFDIVHSFIFAKKSQITGVTWVEDRCVIYRQVAGRLAFYAPQLCVPSYISQWYTSRACIPARMSQRASRGHFWSHYLTLCHHFSHCYSRPVASRFGSVLDSALCRCLSLSGAEHMRPSSHPLLFVAALRRNIRLNV